MAETLSQDYKVDTRLNLLSNQQRTLLRFEELFRRAVNEGDATVTDALKDAVPKALELGLSDLLIEIIDSFNPLRLKVIVANGEVGTISYHNPYVISDGTKKRFQELRFEVLEAIAGHPTSLPYAAA